MHLLWSLIVGLVVGALAKLVMPGKDPGGIIITMLLGVAGSIVASLLGGRSASIIGATPARDSSPRSSVR